MRIRLHLTGADYRWNAFLLSVDRRLDQLADKPSFPRIDHIIDPAAKDDPGSL